MDRPTVFVGLSRRPQAETLGIRAEFGMKE